MTPMPRSRAVRWLHTIEDLVLAGALALLVGLAGAQIILRMGFDSGILWLEPMLRILVLWVALLGAMVAAREQRHIGLDIIERLLPLRILRVAQFIAYMFAAAISALLAWHALRMVVEEYAIGAVAFASVPAWVAQAILPFAFAMIALRLAFGAFRSPVPRSSMPAGAESST